MYTVHIWSTLPPDTQYYDITSCTALKQENNKVYEWSSSIQKWINSTDYISWIPVQNSMIKNPNYVAQ